MAELIHPCLLTDGSSDRMLIPIIEWAMQRKNMKSENVTWVNPAYFKSANELYDKILQALELHDSCNLLFVHRDSEKQDPDMRYQEIQKAFARIKPATPHVAIVPIRMSEAWLLFNEKAIRFAAGRPSGKSVLNLPKASKWESLPDPKQDLENALRIASETKGRERKNFNQEISQRIHRVANQISDFTPLLNMTAYKRFEQDLDLALACFK